MAALESVGVAVVGCGSTAERRHLPAWKRLESQGVRLVAAVSRDIHRARAVAERYGIEYALDDWRAVAARTDVDVVDICLPHPLHTEVSVYMLRAGKHVLCEKPFSTTFSGAQEMAAAAQASGVLLMPFHNMRLGGLAQRAIAEVRSGTLGTPVLVRGGMAHGGPDRTSPRRRWFLDGSAGGGVVLDLGPHVFDLLEAMGQGPRRLRALLRTPMETEVEADGLVQAELHGGALAELSLSWSMSGARESELVIQGTLGTLRLTLLRDPPDGIGGPTQTLVMATKGAGENSIRYLDPLPDDEPCAALVRALRGAVPVLTAVDGVQSMRWVESIYRSDRAGGGWIDCHDLGGKE